MKATLSALGNEFSRATGRKPGGIWAEAAKDARFISRLDQGAGFNVKTFDRAVQWFSDNWPEGAEWPSDVTRPAAHIEGAAA